MNPFPQFPILPAPGWIDLVALVGVAAVAAVVGAGVILGLTIWSARDTGREGARIICPIGLRPVRVLFRVSPLGRRVDVLRCSMFGRGPITCGKGCLHPAPAA